MVLLDRGLIHISLNTLKQRKVIGMEKQVFIDLHMHTNYSDDGEYTPTQIVRMCHEKGVNIMAITDHNCVKAIGEAHREAEMLGISYIPAAEFDCHFNGINLHVLGYGIDYKQPIFHFIEENILNQELANSELKLKLTNSLGFEISKEQLDTYSKNGVYTGELFAEVLLNDPRYNHHEVLKPYRKGGNRDSNPYVNFYWDFYAQGKPCYTEMKYPTLEEIIKTIHDANGIAVIAHPGNNLKGQFNLIDQMFQDGLDGVEAFSSYHNEETTQYFYGKATSFGRLITCGSDFHGKTKPSIQLNQTGCMIDQKIIVKQLIEYQLIGGK